MEKFTKIISQLTPLKIQNVDTDQIIPARFLKAVSREGFGENLFRDWRYDSNNEPIKDFVLNNHNKGSQILIAGRNFGCGSSREHAAWAICDFDNNPNHEFTVDLENQIFFSKGLKINYSFSINEYNKSCLLNGYDNIDYLLSVKDKIIQFENSR